MIKEKFNKLYNLNEIINVYKHNATPTSLCLLWNKEVGDTLLNTENNYTVETEDEKGVSVDERTELSVH